MFDFKFGKIFEDPAVLERIVDDRQQLSRGGDDRFSCTAAFLDALIEGVQISLVSGRDERALHQGRPHQLVATFGDPPAIVRIVGLADLRHDADIGRQLVGAFKVIDISDPRKQNSGGA